MKKLIYSVLLLLWCSGLSVNAQSYTLSFTYYSDENGDYATCMGFSKRPTEMVDVVIPETISKDGFIFIVNAISDFAFTEDDRKNILKSIKFPQSLETIGWGAFMNCDSLTFLEIPGNVKSIGKDAFSDCYHLKKAIIHCSGKFDNSIFDYLESIIYTNPTPPINWVATTRTYVPNKEVYTSPFAYLTSTPHVIEMITFNENTFDYTGAVPSVRWTNNVDGYNAIVNMSALKPNAGNHVNTILATFSDSKHTFTTKIPYRYTIKPIPLIAKVSNATREYGGYNPEFKISYSGFLSGDNESVLTTMPKVSTIATKTSNVGEYPITLSGGYATNYEFVYEPGVLTITKAPLSAKVNDTTKIYGNQNPAFTIDYYGLKNGETAPAWTTRPTFQTDATKASSVGNYAVKATNGIPVNYDLREITTGTLHITPASLTISANDAARQYYSDEPTFSYRCNGFVNGEDESVLSTKPTLSTTATRTSNVGTYEIKVGETSSPNYTISYINGTLTITPRTLTASVGNYERIYNEENPMFEVKYDGFVGNEDESVLSAKATASTMATKTSNVGTYRIDVTGGSAENYKFNYTSGILTINKAEQTISWNQDLNGLKIGDQIELKAVASSVLPITYMMDENNAAELYSTGSKTYLDCKAGGQFLIRAVQDGNNNYYSSPRVSKTISIIGNNPSSDPILTIKQADNGSVGVQVSKGSVYTFTIAPSNGWKIHSVTFNNSDVTSLLKNNNAFTTPAIISNSTLSVVYEQGDDSAVKLLSMSNVKIQATSLGVRVIDANIDDIIRVYTVDGILLNSVKVDGKIVDIPLYNDNVYVIKVGTKTVKLSH